MSEALPVSGQFVDGEHHFGARVYYEDTDAGGVVYHARYLHFAERARTEFLRLTGMTQPGLRAEHDMVFAVRDCSLDFLRPAHLDDYLEIRTRFIAMTGVTLSAVQAFWCGADLLAKLRVRLASINTKGRPIRIPGAVSQILSSYIRAPETQSPDTRTPNTQTLERR